MHAVFASSYEHPWLKLSTNSYSYVRELRDHDRLTEGWMIAGDTSGNQFIKFVRACMHPCASAGARASLALHTCC